MKLSKLVIAAMMMTMAVGGKAFAGDPNMDPNKVGCALIGHVRGTSPERDGFQRVAAQQDDAQPQNYSKRKVSDRQ